MKILYYLFFVFFLFVKCKNTDVNSLSKEVEQPNFIVNSNLTSLEYSSFNGYIPDSGFIPTADIAVSIGEIVLIAIYGKDKIEAQKPFSVILENNVWIIEGSLKKGFLGGVAYIEINKNNGEIMKVVHTK